MPVSEITHRAALAPAVTARIAREIEAITGATVAFYGPDGAAIEPEAGRPSAEPTARLVRDVAETQEDRTAVVSGRLVAAWPIHLRARVGLIATAELPAAGPADGPLARCAMAAVQEAVRAQVAEARGCADRDSLSEALSQSFEEISLLHNLGEVLSVTRPTAELLEYVCSSLRETTEAEAAVGYLPRPDSRDPLIVVAGRVPFAQAHLPALVDQLLAEVGPGVCVLINNHCQQTPSLAQLSTSLKQVVLVPLLVSDDVRGAIVAFNRREDEFGSPDAKLVRSAANASAVFIENRRLYRELHAMMLDLVRALVSSVDAKDPYTCGHSTRVAVTSRELARQIGLSEEEVEQAYMAGLLHDIGKIGTPEAILRKEGVLQPDERDIVSRHPETGGRILKGIHELEAIREAVVHHHERPDGRGYPDGLKGDEVPVLARIVALADAFDAMTSNRPYRPMLPVEHVRREIERNSGMQFDPQIVQAFSRIDLGRLMVQFAERVPALTS